MGIINNISLSCCYVFFCRKTRSFILNLKMSLFLFSSKNILGRVVIQFRSSYAWFKARSLEGTFKKYRIPRYLSDLWNRSEWRWGPASLFRNEKESDESDKHLGNSDEQVWEITAPLTLVAWFGGVSFWFLALPFSFQCFLSPRSEPRGIIWVID